jgi:hypothetical protein
MFHAPRCHAVLALLLRLMHSTPRTCHVKHFFAFLECQALSCWYAACFPGRPRLTRARARLAPPVPTPPSSQVWSAAGIRLQMPAAASSEEHPRAFPWPPAQPFPSSWTILPRRIPDALPHSRALPPPSILSGNVGVCTCNRVWSHSVNVRA